MPHQLVDFFLRQKIGDQEIPVIDNAVMDYLKEKDYEGNIRELQNLVVRISLKYVGKGPITLGDIPEHDRQIELPVRKSWYEKPDLAESIAEALQMGMMLKT